MKLFRFAGLLVIAAALLTGSAKTATATGITCWKYCSGHFYSGTCTASLAQCCNINRRTCPDPWEFESGDCTDGQNYCP